MCVNHDVLSLLLVKLFNVQCVYIFVYILLYLFLYFAAALFGIIKID